MSAELQPKHFETVKRWDDLPTRINKLHVMSQQDAINAIDRARLAGELLIEAKKTVVHGNWLAWLAENITFSAKTASNYMRVARSLPKLQDEDRQRVADLSFRDLLSALATDSNRLATLPAPAIETALETAEAFPLKKSVTRARTAERVRRDQKRANPAPTKSITTMTSVVTAPAADIAQIQAMSQNDAAAAPIPQWRIDLRDEIVTVIRAAIAERGLSTADALDAINDAYCELQDGAP